MGCSSTKHPTGMQKAPVQSPVSLAEGSQLEGDVKDCNLRKPAELLPVCVNVTDLWQLDSVKGSFNVAFMGSSRRQPLHPGRESTSVWSLSAPSGRAHHALSLWGGGWGVGGAARESTEVCKPMSSCCSLLCSHPG